MKVLLAEDSLTMRRLLSIQLQGWDYEVVEAEDGQQAWDLFQQDDFWIVLTDWQMPNMDGVELIRRIRDDLSTPYVYTILLTSRTGRENLVEAMESGADDFIGKPVDPPELKVRLRAGERIARLEQTLIRKNKELAETQAALVQTEKLAGVGQLAAGMAHEINSPLTIITNNLAVLNRETQSLMQLIDHYGSIESVLEDADDSTVARLNQAKAKCDLPWLRENLSQLFKSVSESVSRVREIVIDLRDFAHLDEAEYDSMNVAGAMESTLKILAADLSQRRLALKKELDSTATLNCKPAKIKQLFHEILVNAIQASPDGGQVAVRISADDDLVVIEVTDEGAGMDRLTQKKLFEPFYTTRPVGSGRGLGLAVCYGIVAEHGGTIEFETSENDGTTFRIQLPHRSML